MEHMGRRYELCLTPAEAIAQLSASQAAHELRNGSLRALGRMVAGTIDGGNSMVELSATFSRRFAVREPLTAGLTIELVPTERGCEFTVARARGMFVSREMAPTVGFCSIVLALLSLMYWPVAVAVALLYALIIAVVWLRDGRYVVAARQSLVNVVWRAWSPALVGSERSGYRALACAEAA